MIDGIRKLVQYSLFKGRFKTPRVVTLFVTSHCNALCKHCFYWQSLNRKQDLTLEEIEGLSRSLGKVDTLLISGGEPFLRPDLPEIIQLFFENNDPRSVSIPTNALLPDTIHRQLTKILEVAQGRLVHLVLSLDGTERLHDEIRGVPGNFKKLVQTYERVRPLQKEYPNLTLRINSTVLSRNYEDLFQLYEEMPKLFPDIHISTLSLARGTAYEESLILPSEEELSKLYNHKMAKIQGRRSPLHRLVDKAIFELSRETLRQGTQVVSCEAGRILGVVEDNGDVKHCELLPPIGSLREKSFMEIWNSPLARAERQKIVEKECHCTHECFLYPSLLAHPTQAIKLLRNDRGR